MPTNTAHAIAMINHDQEQDNKTMETKHTQGPWAADKWAPGWTVSAPDCHYSICRLEDCNNAEANAAFIVKATNNFDLFIVACENAINEIERGNHDKALHALKTVLEGAGHKTLPEV